MATRTPASGRMANAMAKAPTLTLMAAYAGEWQDDQPNGQGIERDKFGSATYIGKLKDGKHVSATAIALALATATQPPAKPANTVAAPTAAPVVVPTAQRLSHHQLPPHRGRSARTNGNAYNCGRYNFR